MKPSIFKLKILNIGIRITFLVFISIYLCIRYSRVTDVCFVSVPQYFWIFSEYFLGDYSNLRPNYAELWWPWHRGAESHLPHHWRTKRKGNVLWVTDSFSKFCRNINYKISDGQNLWFHNFFSIGVTLPLKIFTLILLIKVKSRGNNIFKWGEIPFYSNLSDCDVEYE